MEDDDTLARKVAFSIYYKILEHPPTHVSMAGETIAVPNEAIARGVITRLDGLETDALHAQSLMFDDPETEKILGYGVKYGTDNLAELQGAIMNKFALLARSLFDSGKTVDFALPGFLWRRKPREKMETDYTVEESLFLDSYEALFDADELDVLQAQCEGLGADESIEPLWRAICSLNSNKKINH